MFRKLLCVTVCLTIYLLLGINGVEADFFTRVFDYMVNKVDQQSGESNNGRVCYANGQPCIVYYYNNASNTTCNPYFVPQQPVVFSNSNNVNNPNFVFTNQNVTLTSSGTVKSVAISPDGRQIARVVQSANKEREWVVLRIQPSYERVILNVTTPEVIENAYLVGSRYLVCVIRNINNLCHLRVVDLQSQNINQRSILYRNLFPVNNATHIKVVTPRNTNNEWICTISFNGTTYVTQKINLRTGNSLYSIENNQAPVVDKTPDVRIFYNVSTNVLGTQSSCDACLASLNSSNAISSNGTIESISDISRTQYVAIVGSLCYKIEMQNNDSVVLRAIDLNGRGISDYCTVNGISSLLDCAVNLDFQGAPLFITVGSGSTSRNFPLPSLSNGQHNGDVETLNSEFGGIGWSRTGYTGDGLVWVLCVYTQPFSRFFIYDTRNGGISEVTEKGLQVTKYLNKQQIMLKQQTVIGGNGIVNTTQIPNVQPLMMQVN